jgi:hypothetical protein
MLVASPDFKAPTVKEKRYEIANVFFAELVACLPRSQDSYAVVYASMIPMVPALPCDVGKLTQFTAQAAHFGDTDTIITVDVAVIQAALQTVSQCERTCIIESPTNVQEAPVIIRDDVRSNLLTERPQWLPPPNVPVKAFPHLGSRGQATNVYSHIPAPLPIWALRVREELNVPLMVSPPLPLRIDAMALAGSWGGFSRPRVG